MKLKSEGYMNDTSYSSDIVRCTDEFFMDSFGHSAKIYFILN